MAEGIITIKGREKLCRAHAGDIFLPKITQMCFGDGGVNDEGEVIDTTGQETDLRNQLFVKDISSHAFPIPMNTTCRYTVRLLRNELANKFISEQGLIDEEGDLIAYKTFLPKGKDADMEFDFHMDEIF